MSTTQTPSRDPLPPTVPAPEALGLYDAQHWETAYRHFDEDAVPQLLLHLQDDLTRSRKREAAWLSVIVHLLVIILFVNQPRLEGFYRRVFLHQQPVMSVSVQDLLRQKELTYIELPPDLQKVTKRPDTNVISDKDRTASSRTPQLDPKELKKLMASSRPGNPGPGGPQPQQPPTPDQASQAQNNGGQPASQQGAPPQQIQNQISQLQPPVQPSPQIKFGGSMSAGSQIEQAARAAAQNRGGFGGDGGDFGLNQGARAGAQGQLEVLTDTMGVDFNPYLARVLHDVKQQWYALIPESVWSKKGRVVIQFFIMKDGSVRGLETVSSSRDAAMDRPAYGSITGSNPFPPLPKEFPGPYLGLRFSYYYNLNTDGSEIH
jgi:TonB family protein